MSNDHFDDIPNTPENSETPEKTWRSPEEKSNTVYKWISDGIEKKQKVEDNAKIRDAINDPAKYDELIHELRDDIDMKFREDADNTNDPIDKDTINDCLENKTFIILKIQKSLFKRELAERDLHKYWTKYTIKDASGNTLSADEIQDIIEEIPANELSALKRNINRSMDFFATLDHTITTPHISEYIADMGIDMMSIDEETRKRILLQFAVFEWTWDFDEEVLSLLLDRIPNTEKRRQAIERILPKISLKDAVEKWLISDREEEDFLENTFFEYIRDNGLFRSGENKSNYFDSSLDPILLSQRKYHREAFLAEARKNTSGVFIKTKDLEFFQEGLDTSESSFDHRKFDAAFAALLPLLCEEFKERVTDNEQQNQKDLLESAGSFDEIRNYMSRQDLPVFAEGSVRDLESGAYISTQIADPDTGMRQDRSWKIASTDEVIDGVRGVRLISYNNLWEHIKDEFVSYADFAKNFIAEVTGIAIDGSVKVSKNKPNFIEKEDLIDSITDLTEVLNDIDPEWRRFSLENGLYFTTEMNDTKEIVRISNILESSRQIQITDKNGEDFTLSWLEFVYYLKEGNKWKSLNFERIGHFENQRDFVEYSAISGSLRIEDKKIQFENTGEKDASGNNTWSNLKVLSNGEWEHILLEKIKENSLIIKHYKNETKTDKDGNEIPVFDKNGNPKKGYGSPISANYWRLEEFVRQGFTEPRKAPPKTQRTSQEMAEKEHGNKSFLWGVLSEPGSLYSKYLAVKMGFNKLKASQDQKAQVQAAEAMYHWAKRYLPEWSDMRYAFTTEFSHTVGGEINKKIEELGTLGASEKRARVRKILLTKPAKPYELFAALIVIAKMTGELYPDQELGPLQGDKYLWFRALAESMNLNPDEELQAAKKKVIDEYKLQSNHPPETALITRLFKKNNAHPYVTAISSGSKYWHAVTEGLEWQKSKWQKESKVLGGAEEASIYAMSKFKSNELPIVAGAIPEIYGKDPSAQYMTPAFVWAMSNATSIVRFHVSKEDVFNKNIFGNGSYFHAFPFCMSPAGAKKYQNTVREVVKYLVAKNKISAGDQQKFESLCAKIEQSPNTHDEEVFAGFGAFWNKYYSTLHPILQVTTPELMVMLRDDTYNQEVIKDYLYTFHDLAGMRGSMEAPMSEEILIQNGYNADANGSMNFGLKVLKEGINGEKDICDYKNRSLKYVIEKATKKINVHNLTMDSTTYKYIWRNQVYAYINSIRTNETFRENPEFQKEQYIILIKEVISALRENIRGAHHTSELFENAKKDQDNAYLKDLEGLGVNISDYENFKGSDLDTMAEEAYWRFIRSQPEQHTTDDILKSIPTTAQKIVNTGSMGRPANDENFEGAA